MFEFAFDELGVGIDEVVHVGAGYLTDMVPAYELGLTRVWINRRGERPDESMPPSAELPDLTRIEAAIEGLGRVESTAITE